MPRCSCSSTRRRFPQQHYVLYPEEPLARMRRQQRRLSAMMMMMMTTALLCLLLPRVVVSFSAVVVSTSQRQYHHHRWPLAAASSSSDASAAVRDLLYWDQQQAMVRRAAEEEQLLEARTQLLEPAVSSSLSSSQGHTIQKTTKRKTGGGGGFGATSGTTSSRSRSRTTTTRTPKKSQPKNKKKSKRRTAAAASTLGQQYAAIVERDGVALIEHVLSKETAESLRNYVLRQQQEAAQVTQAQPHKAQSFYGVEPTRQHRCDLQLSLLQGGYTADGDDNGTDDGTGTTSATTTAATDDTTEQQQQRHILADALSELLHPQNGTLFDIFDTLVTTQGELYELATVITHPGSPRQIIHPDLPFQDIAPLYVVFLALQDVTVDMGPTSFLLQSHTAEVHTAYTQGDAATKNAHLAQADCRLSCLQQGDCVVFDARVLHCGNANTAPAITTTNDSSTAAAAVRALFNFSFRNPLVTGPLGYEGSIRPGYVQAMTLQDMGEALELYQDTGKRTDPFAQYGSGLLH